jgi:hypothetical protein
VRWNVVGVAHDRARPSRGAATDPGSDPGENTDGADSKPNLHIDVQTDSDAGAHGDAKADGDPHTDSKAHGDPDALADFHSKR